MCIWKQLPADRLLVDVSLWSANLAVLGNEIKRMEPYADLFHIDVSDDHFVPGLLFFPDLVVALRPFTRIPFHVHLMVEHPLPLIDIFIKAGADIITIQCENGAVVPAALERIHSHNKAAGLALSLGITPEVIVPYLHHLDLILVMGTALGIKGEDPSEMAYQRIQVVRQIIQRHSYAKRIKIGVDGGIRRHTVPRLRVMGTDIIVPGSLVFKSDDIATTFQWLWTLPGQQDG
jgi:ribulose-phosphate 3-epimerase